MWNSGMAAMTTSSPGVNRMFHEFDWVTLATRLRCVSIAAFGRPVVPPVYWSTAIVVRGSDFASGTDPEVPSAFFQGRTQGSVGKSVGSFCLRSTLLTNGRRYHG